MSFLPPAKPSRKIAKAVCVGSDGLALASCITSDIPQHGQPHETGWSTGAAHGLLTALWPQDEIEVVTGRLARRGIEIRR